MTLPAALIAERLSQTLATRPIVVVTAPPGAGKSTLLPLSLLDDGAGTGRILMLEPRRLAARQVAERMAFLRGESVGDTVGYRIRFESRVSSRTRIEVLTEGILTRMLLDDPTLDGVSIVIFDEFHERSLASDEALALTRQVQQLLRPDLKIVVMSATLDADALCRTLDAPVVSCTGRQYPVEVVRALPSGGSVTPIGSLHPADVAQATAEAVVRAHRAHEGDILVFLPGENEIRRCAERLADSLAPTRVMPLYGMLSSAEQDAAIAPSAAGSRKVVLATSIAETSLTIEGVRVVIDTGLCRQPVFDAGSGLTHLETQRISLDRAEQRSGRAGRVAPGVCYRLWTAATEQQMEPFRQPEIADADLTPLLLDLRAWGETDATRLPWVTAPSAARLQQAERLLTLLGALDDGGELTPHGRRLAALPCHPRLAQMLVGADTPALRALAADLAALIEERDPLGSDADGADIALRVDSLRRRRSRWPRLTAAADQYRRMIHAPQDDAPADAFHAGRLLASAYPERIAHDDGHGLYRLASGESASLDADDALAIHSWLVVARMAGGRIVLAAPLAEGNLKPFVQRRERLSWDARRGCVVAVSEEYVGTLVVASQPLALTDRTPVVRVVAEALLRYGPSMLDYSDAFTALQQRLAAVSSWHPELSLPSSDTDSLLHDAPQWLPLFMGRATTVAELKKIDLATVLWSRLSWEQQQRVDALAPSTIAVPSGSHIRVEYRSGELPPILRVRLQECFGLTATPSVDDGRRPVLMELLSPGFKPIQRTQDLTSFWSDTYFEVRKELRRRYPKHSWPDNPLEAPAVRGVKKK